MGLTCMDFFFSSKIAIKHCNWLNPCVALHTWFNQLQIRQCFTVVFATEKKNPHTSETTFQTYVVQGSTVTVFTDFITQLPIGHCDPTVIYGHRSCPLVPIFNLCYSISRRLFLEESETLIIIMINITGLSTVCKGYGTRVNAISRIS